jgi:murein DD-endopeptidase MepM/ murein hydrolase activator NlpD
MIRLNGIGHVCGRRFHKEPNMNVSAKHSFIGRISACSWTMLMAISWCAAAPPEPATGSGSEAGFEARLQPAPFENVAGGCLISSELRPINHEPALHETCLSPVDSARIFAQARRYFRDNHGAARFPPYAFYPMAGTVDRDIIHGNFVDLQPGAGVLDLNCTMMSYDGHNGIDTTVRSFAEHVIGMPIFAVADGTVIGAHDGEPDMNTQWLGQPANYVSIDHGGGRVCAYLHMKNGSVAVSVGEKVRAGRQIGMAASSGNSTWPHLHFQSIDFPSGEIFESFAGPCRPGPSGWVQQAPLKTETFLIDFGPTWIDLTTVPLLPFAQPRSGQFALTDGPIRFWGVGGNAYANSVGRTLFRRPDGTIAFDSGVINFNNPPFRFFWIRQSFDVPDMHILKGTWHIIFMLNDRTMIEAPVEVFEAHVPGFNRPPALIALAFEPPNPTVDDVLFCRIDSPNLLDDLDYDTLRYHYVWSVDGEIVRDVTTAARSDAIPHHVVPCYGAAVEVTVTPNDGTVDGAPVVAQVMTTALQPADINCDGVVNINDLMAVINAWGPCPGQGPCLADFDGNGSVDVADLLGLLANWS